MALLCTVVLGFLSTYLTVRTLSKEQFGLWSVLTALAGQFMLLEFGFRSALVSFLTRAKIQSDYPAQKQYVTVALLLLGCIAIAPLILGLSGYLWLHYLIVIPSHITLVVYLAWLIVCVDSALDIITTIPDSFLAAYEQYGSISRATVVRVFTYFLLVSFAYLGSAEIIWFAGALLVSRLIQRFFLLSRFISCLRDAQSTQTKAHISQSKRSTVTELFRFGVHSWSMALSIRLIYTADVVLVGYLFGAEAAALYAVPNSLVEQIRNLTVSSVSILTPRFSARLNSTEAEDGDNLAYSATVLLATATAIIVATLIACGKPLLFLLAGAPFVAGFPILVVLSIPFVVTSCSQVLLQRVLGSGDHEHVSAWLLCEGTFNVVLSILFGRLYGPIGVALGTLLPSILIRGIFIPLIVIRKTSLSKKRILTHAYLIPTVLFFVVVTCGMVTSSIFDGSALLQFLVTGIICTAVGAALGYAALSHPHRESVLLFFK